MKTSTIKIFYSLPVSTERERELSAKQANLITDQYLPPFVPGKCKTAEASQHQKYKVWKANATDNDFVQLLFKLDFYKK